jgi:hypothetical protein
MPWTTPTPRFVTFFDFTVFPAKRKQIVCIASLLTLFLIYRVMEETEKSKELYVRGKKQ